MRGIMNTYKANMSIITTISTVMRKGVTTPAQAPTMCVSGAEVSLALHIQIFMTQMPRFPDLLKI